MLLGGTGGEGHGGVDARPLPELTCAATCEFWLPVQAAHVTQVGAPFLSAARVPARLHPALTHCTPVGRPVSKEFAGPFH